MNLYNLEIEQAALGVLLHGGENTAHFCAKFTDADWYHPLHALLFQTIKAKVGAGAAVSAVTIKQAIGSHAEMHGIDDKYLTQLVMAAGSMIAMGDYAAILQDLARKRMLEAACKQTLERLEGAGNDVSAEQLALELDAARRDITSAGMGRIMKTEKQVMADLWDDITNRVNPISTGLKRLDAAMDGGLYPRRAYGILARKKMGKTVMAATIAKNVADAGHPVLFIAAEMGDKEIQERVACRMMGIFPSGFRSEYRNSVDFSRKFSEAIHGSSKNLIYAKKPGIKFDTLKQLIPAAIHRYGIKGFILDYWQLVGGKTGKTSEREHLDEVAQWLADYARDNDLWCLVMGQENQDGNSRGGEGIRLAFDQVYRLCGEETATSRWMEMMDTRYTKWGNIGSECAPAFNIEEKGPYISENEASNDNIRYSAA